MYTAKFKALMVFIYAIIIACFVGLPISFLAFGSELNTRQSSLYPYRSMIEFNHEFFFSTLLTLTGGTTTAIVSETNRIGLIRRDTSAVINTYTGTSISGTSSSIFGDLPHSLIWVVRLNVNDANTSAKIGAQSSAFNITPAQGIYFEKLGPDTNWFCVSRSASVETRTDSGIAVNTSFNTFSYTRSSSQIEYFINNSLVCTITTNLPSSSLNPTVALQNLDAASKTVDFDYFQMRIMGLVR